MLHLERGQCPCSKVLPCTCERESEPPYRLLVHGLAAMWWILMLGFCFWLARVHVLRWREAAYRRLVRSYVLQVLS